MAEKHEVTTEDGGRKLTIFFDDDGQTRVLVPGGPHQVRFQYAQGVAEDGGDLTIIRVGERQPKQETPSTPKLKTVADVPDPLAAEG